MNFVPSPTILAGIIAGVLLPLVLASLSHGPWKVLSPGRRFRVSAGLVSIAWALYLAWRQPYFSADLVASMLIWATALLVVFSFWSLLAWGFTVSLLMALARAERPLTMDEWVGCYTGGGTVETFARDRLSLLFRTGMARLDGDHVRMNPGWGPRLAWLVGAMRKTFGVES